jgi:MSHA biogenesis protein MshG
MPAFSYKARNNRGELHTGRLEGASAEAVADELLRTGLTPVHIATLSARAEAGAGFLGSLLAERVATVDLMLFCRQMASLLKAGVPILRALSTLADSSAKAAFAKVLRDVRDGLAGGRELSACLNKHPKVFGPFFVNMVRVGEATGRLDEIFMRMFRQLEFDKEMRDRVKSALRYPSFVVIALGVALFVINLMVIPAFAKVYQSAKTELPIMTKILIGFSDWTVHYWPLMLALLGMGLLGFRLWKATADGRYRWDKFLLTVPIAGKIVHKAALARFANGLAMAYASGVPIVQGLTAVSEVADNRFMAGRIEQLRDSVERGESLTRAATATGVFTPMVLQMINVGEETGDLERLLAEVGEMYQREVEYELKTQSEQIEPLLIAALGGIVLVLALGVFLPIWDLGQTMLKK